MPRKKSAVHHTPNLPLTLPAHERSARSARRVTALHTLKTPKPHPRKSDRFARKIPAGASIHPFLMPVTD